MLAGRCTPAFLAIVLSCAPSSTAVRRQRRNRYSHVEEVDAEVFHPGHPAVYTARLLRNEHAGIAAMLEWEARWLRPSSSLVEESEAEEEVIPAGPRVRLSAQQISWLHEHQLQALAQGQEAPSSSLLQGSEEDEPTPLKLSSLKTEYVGPIGVGSVNACGAMVEGAKANSQGCKSVQQSSVWVVFDTGSTNLWVNSDACTKGSCAKAGRLRYNHSASSSYKAPAESKDLKVTFGTGKMTGPLAFDDFHVGPITLHGQEFGMIREQEGAVFESYPIEGILGLAFPGMAAKGTTPFFDNVIKQKALVKNEIAFYFSLNNPSANAMLWGGVDSKFHTMPIEYFNVSKPFYWGLDLKAFQIGGKDMLDDPADHDGEAWEAIIDTGTTYWTAPTQLFAGVMAQLKAIPCAQMTNSSHPPITFRFENAAGQPRDFTMNNDQYMVSAGGKDNWCSLALMQLNMRSAHERSMIFGEVFLRQYFSVFDRADGKPENARVGFALAAQGEEVDSHLKSITKDQPLFSERHRESAK